MQKVLKFITGRYIPVRYKHLTLPIPVPRVYIRAVDPHSLYADPDPDPAVFLHADQRLLKSKKQWSLSKFTLKTLNKVAVISNFLPFFQFLVDKFTLLDPDPQIECECGSGSGSRRENEYGSGSTALVYILHKKVGEPYRYIPNWEVKFFPFINSVF